MSERDKSDILLRAIAAVVLSSLAFWAAVIMVDLLVDHVLEKKYKPIEVSIIRIIGDVGCAIIGVVAARMLCDAVLAEYKNKAIGVCFAIFFGAWMLVVILFPPPDDFVPGELVFAGIAAVSGISVFWQDDPFDEKKPLAN